MTTLVVVRAGWRPAERMLAFRTFAARGWRIAIMDRVLNQSLCLADVPVVCDLAAIPQAAAALRAKVGRPDGILTFSDTALHATAQLAEFLGLPFLPVQLASEVTNKQHQRQVCEKVGVPIPEWRSVAGEDEALAAVRGWGRAIIKPTGRAAGVAVRLAASAATAAEAYREAAAAAGAGGGVLVERYLEGPEFSVESIAVGGRQQPICVTSKITTQGPWFVEIGHCVPAVLPASQCHAITRVAMAACHALNLTWGACHTEVKLTQEGPVIVEVNARPAGDRVLDLIQLALRVNVYELLGRQALGEDLEAGQLLPRQRQAAAIHFRLSTPGVFRDAASELESRPPHWLVDLSVAGPAGQVLRQPRSNYDRIGYAIALGDTSAVAAARAKSAIDSVTVRAEPVVGETDADHA